LCFQLLPIYAKDILFVGARGYGFLAAAPAGGAIVAGLVMAAGRASQARRHGHRVCRFLRRRHDAFGVSRVFWFSLFMLATTGAADTVSTILRQTIRQLVTLNKLRGRMTSINMIFFMGGLQLGEVEAGTVAAWRTAVSYFRRSRVSAGGSDGLRESEKFEAI
jgi:hypothetical protein